jgi:hypothetical protein
VCIAARAFSAICALRKSTSYRPGFLASFLVCKAPSPGLLTQAAALVAGINTDEYLYLNFIANAQRGILLYALDARFPRVMPPRRAWKVLQETLLKPNTLQIPSGLQKASFQTNLRLIAHKYCPRMLPSSTSPERDPSRLTLPSSIFESPSTRARYTYRIDTSTYKKLHVTDKRKSTTCTVSNVTSSRIRDRLNTSARVIITYNVYPSSFAIYPTRESMKIHLIPRINIGADVWGESSIMTGVY